MWNGGWRRNPHGTEFGTGNLEKFKLLSMENYIVI